MTYNSAEIQELTGLSRQTLSSARNGYTKKNGTFIKPRIEQYDDWDWSAGKIIYYECAVEKLKNAKTGRKKKEAPI